ncbi:MAG: HD domain-containing protein [Marinilabiliales bacterium]|nr:HD domain-containing protein [Marinilabiliales bacterium]
MNEIPVKDLEQDTYFSKPVLLDQDYLLLSTETPVTRTLINHLIEWGYRTVFTEGVPQQIIPLAESEEAGEASAENGQPVIAVNAGDGDRMEYVRSFYGQFASFVESIYDRYVTKNELVLAEVSVRIKSLCEVIAENRRFILRVQSLVQPHSNYLVSHSTRTTVLSIVVGSALKLPNHRLIELGTAALLHEIGMVRLPPQLYMASRQLSPQERKSITAHPILGYNVLKEKQVPLAISLAALEHHERMNGAGYPRGHLRGQDIPVFPHHRRGLFLRRRNRQPAVPGSPGRVFRDGGPAEERGEEVRRHRDPRPGLFPVDLSDRLLRPADQRQARPGRGREPGEPALPGRPDRGHAHSRRQGPDRPHRGNRGPDTPAHDPGRDQEPVQGSPVLLRPRLPYPSRMR